MDAYLIVGNPHTRKSSLVRCLTGCFNRSVRDIALRDGAGVLKLYARAGALQDTRCTPADFIAETERSRCQAVLCCLAPDRHGSQPALYPDAAAYVEAFAAAGWPLRGIAVLGQNAGALRSPVLRLYPHAPAQPINLTAQAVRAQFGWA